MAMEGAKCRLDLSFPCMLLVISSCLPHVTSLSFDYNFSSPGVLAGADLKYMNDSVPGPDQVDLTNLSRSWSTGRVAHGQAVRLWDDITGNVASFTTNFTFAAKSLNVTMSQGDGMAFFVGPYPPSMPTDATGGFLALINNPGIPANTYFPPTVGVEFDTFRNVDWDPDDTVNHMGVDVNGIRSKAYAALPDGIFNAGAMSASVRYDAGAATLSATLRSDDMPELSAYTVSANVDLRAAGLPQDAAVGFSAAIGDYVEQHQILSWSFESTLTDDITSRTNNTDPKTKSIGLKTGLVSAGICIFLAVAAWLGYLVLKRKGMHTKKAPDAETPLDQDMDNEFEKGAGPRRFSYSELSRATQGFSDDEKLGEGGFGAPPRAGATCGHQAGLQDVEPGEEGVHRGGDHYRPAAASQPCPARRMVPQRRRAAARLRAHGERQPRRPSLQFQKIANMGSQVQHHSWDGFCADVPAPGVGAVRGAQGHQAQQRDARLVLQRQAGGLRAGAPRRPQPRRTHDNAGRHQGIHGPGVRGDQPGQRRDRRVQLRRRPPGGRLRPEARRPAAAGREQGRAHGVGAGPARERHAPRRCGRPARRRLRRARDGARAGRWTLVRAPGLRLPAVHPASHERAPVRGAATGTPAGDAGGDARPAAPTVQIDLHVVDWELRFRQTLVDD